MPDWLCVVWRAAECRTGGMADACNVDEKGKTGMASCTGRKYVAGPAGARESSNNVEQLVADECCR